MEGQRTTSSSIIRKMSRRGREGGRRRSRRDGRLAEAYLVESRHRLKALLLAGSRRRRRRRRLSDCWAARRRRRPRSRPDKPITSSSDYDKPRAGERRAGGWASVNAISLRNPHRDTPTARALSASPRTRAALSPRWPRPAAAGQSPQRARQPHRGAYCLSTAAAAAAYGRRRHAPLIERRPGHHHHPHKQTTAVVDNEGEKKRCCGCCCTGGHDAVTVAEVSRRSGTVPVHCAKTSPPSNQKRAQPQVAHSFCLQKGCRSARSACSPVVYSWPSPEQLQPKLKPPCGQSGFMRAGGKSVNNPDKPSSPLVDRRRLVKSTRCCSGERDTPMDAADDWPTLFPLSGQVSVHFWTGTFPQN